MDFRTTVAIPKADFQIEPMEEMLFVGSCFADSIGQRFRDEKFRATVNPFGTMYNPVSVLHTIERCEAAARIVFITLGTNHVYRLKETGQIVDNCQKRPQRLFNEERLSIGECADALQRAVDVLKARRSDVRIVFTVSPIRYAKYGYHESQLSKATLLMAIEKVAGNNPSPTVSYFPAYEIVLDELRDYRFYREDMLHPSAQAVEYIWERIGETYFSAATRQFLEEWRPLKQALAHRPFDAESKEYREFLDKTMLKVAELSKKYPTFAL